MASPTVWDIHSATALLANNPARISHNKGIYFSTNLDGCLMKTHCRLKLTIHDEYKNY